MADWSDTKILSTSFFTHSGPNGYEIHFSTPDREKYLAVQKECRGQIGLAKTTQADRIRAMSDEKLAGKLCDDNCPPGYRDALVCGKSGFDCEDCWLNWLKSPAEIMQNAEP